MGHKRNSDSPERRVARLAERQHGVASRFQLHSLGLTDSEIAHGVDVGRLHRVFRGVYAVGHPGIGSLGLTFAAVLACGEGSAVSHGTAAALLGLRDRAPRLIDVIAQGQRGRKVDGIRRRHVPTPHPDEIIARDGIPCTNPARTLVDLAGILGKRSLREAVERAATLGILDLPTIDAATSRRPRRGAPALRAILEAWREIPADELRLRSDLEARLLAMIAAHGLPTPLCNQTVESGGKRREVDLLWPAQRLIVEIDGRRYHSDPAAFERDRRRDRDLTLDGYRVVRITWRQIEREPDVTMAAISRLLAAAAPPRGP